MTTTPVVPGSGLNPARWVRQGAVGGLLAGVVFALFEMAAAAVLAGPGAIFVPLRMIGAILVGPQALDPGYPLMNSALGGLLLHFVLAAIFGAIFGGIAAGLPTIRASLGGLLIASSLYGFGLWLVNFRGLAPIFGWVWFPEANDLVQILAHTFAYGTVLGAYLHRTAVARPAQHQRS